MPEHLLLIATNICAVVVLLSTTVSILCCSDYYCAVRSTGQQKSAESSESMRGDRHVEPPALFFSATQPNTARGTTPVDALRRMMLFTTARTPTNPDDKQATSPRVQSLKRKNILREGATAQGII